jgi:hypothetical protein
MKSFFAWIVPITFPAQVAAAQSTTNRTTLIIGVAEPSNCLIKSAYIIGEMQKAAENRCIRITTQP